MAVHGTVNVQSHHSLIVTVPILELFHCRSDSKLVHLGVARPCHRKSVVVVAAEPDSQAALAGIQPSDVTEEVNRQPVESVADCTKEMAATTNDKPLFLFVRHDESSTFFPRTKQSEPGTGSRSRRETFGLRPLSARI